MFQQFFEHESIQTSLPAPDGCHIALTFDENALKEPRQLLDEIKFLVENGIEDVRTAARELGRSPDALHTGKMHTKVENSRHGVWEPITGVPGAQTGESDRAGDDRGRPPGDNTNLTEETRTRTGTPE